MARRLLFLAVLGASLVALASCQPLPVLVPVTKDTATSLHTIPFNDGAKLVVDIDGPLVWSTCQLPAEFLCGSDTCRLANAYPAPGCNAVGCGSGNCTAYPYNPVTGVCAAGSLVHTKFVASTTDGSKPVSPVSLTAVSACGTGKLLSSLPQGATGVAGLADSGLALPAQVASAQKVAKTFLLCLSRGVDYGNGVAIFGGGPFHLTAVPETDYTQLLDYTPLVAKNGSPVYSVTANYIALDDLESSRVPFPAGALAAGGVVLRTTVPYTLLRPDVYRPFVAAFRTATTKNAREVTPLAPFGLCYDSRTIPSSLSGYLVPSVTLALDGGKNWTMSGANSMVDAVPGTACLAFVQMEGVKAGDGNSPAVVVGGFQMENFVLQFDLEKKRLGFVRVPGYTNCGSFNFTRSA